MARLGLRVTRDEIVFDRRRKPIPRFRHCGAQTGVYADYREDRVKPHTRASRLLGGHRFSALIGLGALFLVGCSAGNSSPAQPTPTVGEREYLSAYETSGRTLSDTSVQVNLNCRDTVVPALLCVVALEDALNASTAFETNMTDLSLPLRFTGAHALLTRALAHAARGFDLWIEALRDRDSAKLGEAKTELVSASRLLHESFQAFPVDVRSNLSEVSLVH